MHHFIARLFSPGGARPSELTAARQRLLGLTSLFTFSVAAIWAAFSIGKIGDGRPLLTLFCVAAPFLFLPFPLLLAAGLGRLNILAHAFVAVLFVVIASVASAIGGAVSTTSFFLVLVPTLATLLLGIRTGAAWLGVTALTLLALHLGRGSLPPPTHELTADDISYWNALTLTLVACALAGSASIFQMAVRQSSELLIQARLKAAEIEAARTVAEAISQSKSEFIANMSHEFRTPLNGIVGYGEMLLESAAGDGRNEDAADARRVLQASKRLQQMVDGMIKLSSADPAKCELVECDIAVLLSDAVDALSLAASARGNHVVTAPCALGVWLCDEQKLGECLDHLLSNAIKFTQHGRISVAARPETAAGQSFLVFEVADTGIGIAERQMEVLFRPFGLVDASATRAQQGAGLGLAITKKLAHAMGGDVSVASILQQGSTFCLRIPAVRAAQCAATRNLTNAA